MNITLDPSRVQRAIATAETKTSGEIRVVLHAEAVADPISAAREEFVRLGMHRTKRRNAVLILVAPRSQNFAILGDEGVHAHCGDAFWQTIAAAMTAEFSQGRFTDGVLQAIARTGEVLAQHFPRMPEDENELPDDLIDRGIVI